MKASTNELATLAARANMTVAAATALPAVVERMAAMVGMHERAFVAEATYRNQGLLDYVARIAEEVAA